MKNVDELVGNPQRDNSRYAFAKPEELFLVYLSHGGEADLDLGRAPGTFSLAWFDPRGGGPLQLPSTLTGGARVVLKAPSEDDWLAVVRRR